METEEDRIYKYGAVSQFRKDIVEEVEAKCLSCGEKYMNKLGYKFGRCNKCKAILVHGLSSYNANGYDENIGEPSWAE